MDTAPDDLRRTVPRGIAHRIGGNVPAAELSRSALTELLFLATFHRRRPCVYRIGDRLYCVLRVGSRRQELHYLWSERHQWWLQTFDQRYGHCCTAEQAESHADRHGVGRDYANGTYA